MLTQLSFLLILNHFSLPYVNHHYELFTHSYNALHYTLYLFLYIRQQYKEKAALKTRVVLLDYVLQLSMWAYYINQYSH